MTIEKTSRLEYANRCRADIKTYINESNPYDDTTFENAFCGMHANRSGEFDDKIQIIIRDSFIRTAQGDALLDIALDYGLTLNSATPSDGNVIVTGQSGVTVAIDTLFQGANGISYETQLTQTLNLNTLNIDQLESTGTTVTATFNDPHGLGSGMLVTIAGSTPSQLNGSFTISVISETVFQYTTTYSFTGVATGSITASYIGAVIPVKSTTVGAVTNLNGGSQLALQQTLSGVDNTAYTQFAGIDGGADEEDLEDLRERLLIKVQNPETPFNKTNITLEALKVSGVTRVWVIEAEEQNVSTNTTITSTSITNQYLVTLTDSHDLITGMYVEFSGANESQFNSGYIATYPDTLLDTQFYVIDSNLTGIATGAIVTDYSNVQPGQVRVFFVRDNDLNIIPSSQEVQDVKDQILTIKPAHTSNNDVIVAGPIEVSQDFEFTALSPDTAGMRTSIESNLNSLFNTSNLGTTITEDAYRTAIQNSYDAETQQSLTSFTITNSGDITVEFNELITLGSITYTV